MNGMSSFIGGTRAVFVATALLLAIALPLGCSSGTPKVEVVKAPAPDPIARRVTHLARQDESRHVAFGMAHLEHQATVDPYLERKRSEFEESGIPLIQENPELWAKLDGARRLKSPRKE